MTHMKKNILVVDDSALMRRVMCDIINSDSKFQATDYCRDGLEAYEKLKHTSYDGVVLDVNMPRMDGLQLLEKLQKEGIRANVVMVSTLTDSREADVTILAMERYPCGSKTGSKGTDNAESDRRKEQTGCTGLFHRRTESVTECDSVSSERTGCPGCTCTAYAAGIYQIHG